MNEKLLMMQRSEGHETIYASLFRKRFAHSGEIKAGSVLIRKILNGPQSHD
jgi:hypothetical protein